MEATAKPVVLVMKVRQPFHFHQASTYNRLARNGGDRLRQEILTAVVMHAGLPYAAR